MKNDQPTPALTSSEISAIKASASRTTADIRTRFDGLFSSWKSSWFTGSAAYSSNTHDNRLLPEYKPLRALGPAILPLLAEALIDEESFPAHVLFEDLLGEDATAKALDNVSPLEGVQSQARRLIRAYLKNHSG